jgi:FkbM family methyltransferase
MAGLVGPDGQVLAVEAEPETFQLLRANIELNALRNVEAIPVAAHRAAGLVTIMRNPHNHGGSTAVRVWSGWSTSPVQAVRLDDVLNPDAPVDVVKIDIEGMDHAAVEGLERTIARWRPVLLVEFNPTSIEMLGEQPAEVFRYYRDLGYAVGLLGGDALRLHREAGMALDELLLDNLIVSPQSESELIQRTKRIVFINLILTPPGNQSAERRART